MAKDYYSILGVAKTATPEEIKSAFRKKAHQHHPDKSGGNAEKFKELNEAYQVLGNPEKRKTYDQFGSEAFSQGAGFGAGGGQGGFNWSDFSRQSGFGASGFRNQDFNISDLGEIFGDFFGGGRSSTRQRTHGEDLEAGITISLQDAVFGAEKVLELTKEITCDHCQGNGAEPGVKINTCKTCKGSGQVTISQATFFGNFRSVAACPDCNGEGQVPEKKCIVCGGRGFKRGVETIKVKVPAGISSGETLKLSGKGGAAERGLRPGDLYINIKVLPHPLFKRSGDNLLTVKNISFSRAALGDKVDVETLDGQVSLKIPAGTPGGQQFSIKGKGVVKLHGHGRGDLLVEVKVIIPNNLSRSQKKLLEDLAKEGL
ncbi:MAG: molecular chaperone DnaJ [Candidatus Komeilibacteria bacterium]|nr:molecular chaperone DnaJ [Candidatus Komeilibacteria bacterium]